MRLVPGISNMEEEMIRQLGLITWLEKIGRPISRATIYQDGLGHSWNDNDTFNERFGRDRDALAAHGIPLEVSGDASSPDGEIFALPKVHLHREIGRLTDAEWAALRMLALRADSGVVRAAIWRMALLSQPSRRGKRLASELFETVGENSKIALLDHEDGFLARFGRLSSLMTLLITGSPRLHSTLSVCRLLGISRRQLDTDLALVNRVRTPDGIRALSASYWEEMTRILAIGEGSGGAFARPFMLTSFEIGALAHAAHWKWRLAEPEVPQTLIKKLERIRRMVDGRRMTVAEYGFDLSDGSTCGRRLCVALVNDRLYTVHDPADYFDLRSDPDVDQWLSLERELSSDADLERAFEDLRAMVGRRGSAEGVLPPLAYLRQKLEGEFFMWDRY